ncbi:MAG: hypothetical protein ACI4R9_08340 [Kiritimatiellia bacterium]
MLDFICLVGSPSAFDIPHLASFPAIVWKQKNLASLKAKDPAKFALQYDRLRDLFQM